MGSLATKERERNEENRKTETVGVSGEERWRKNGEGRRTTGEDSEPRGKQFRSQKQLPASLADPKPGPADLVQGQKSNGSCGPLMCSSQKIFVGGQKGNRGKKPKQNKKQNKKEGWSILKCS